MNLPASGQVAQWVESLRDLLVTGSGKGWRPGFGGHSQRAQQRSLWRAGHTAGWGPSARAPGAKRTGH